MQPVIWLAFSTIVLALGAALMNARRALGRARAEQAHLMRRLAEAERVGRLGVWEARKGSTVVKWSEELHAIFGTTPDTFAPTYDGFLSFVHPDDRTAVAETFQDLGLEGARWIEHRIVTRDGRTRHVRQNWEVLPDEGEGTLRALGTCLDITEWRQREEDLRLFRSIVEATHEAIAIIDPEGRFVYVNKAHEELFGRRLSETREMTYSACAAPDALVELTAAVARGETFEGVVPAVRADGRPFALWLRADSVRGVDGKLRWGFAIMHDRTEAQRAEEALRDSEERYRSVVFNLEEGIVLRTREGNVEAINPAAERIDVDFRQARGVDGGHPDWEAIHEDGSAVDIRTEQPALVALRTGERQSGVVMGFRRADGRLSWYSINSQPMVRRGESEPYAVVSSFTDITGMKQVEQALRATLREKQGLLMEVHHRVKNNLQVITSLLRLESARATDGSVRSVLNDMQARIRSMGVLHETLYRSGEFGRVDLKPYLTQLVNQFFQSQSRSSPVRCVSEIVPAVVAVDQAIPCGLLLNELLTNSLKHGFPEGRAGEVRVGLQADQDRLRLSVTDDGVGLPADFEARRLQSLGLQLVEDLARQIGGPLEIGSGPGASFSVRFAPKEAPHEAGPREIRA